MIVVTVGTQLPFDRLIEAIDRAAPTLPVPVFAQIGRGKYRPQNIEWRRSIPAPEFDRILSGASLIVSHAGIGTVLAAQKLGKPLLLLPRRASLGEHRNDHQLATAAALRGRPGIYVLDAETDVASAMAQEHAGPPQAQEPHRRMRLKAALSDYFYHIAKG